MRLHTSRLKIHSPTMTKKLSLILSMRYMYTCMCKHFQTHYPLHETLSLCKVVLARIELNSLVDSMALCFGFVVNMMLMSQGCFSHC